MAVLKTEWRIEGQTEDENWHTIGIAVPEGDTLAQRNAAIRAIRKLGVTRYKKVRLAKYVTTIEVIGEDIRI